MLPPRERVPLAPFTTLGVGGEARFVVDGESEPAIAEALRWARTHGVPTRVLGGGSNVVVPDDGFDGLVVRVLTRGMTWTDFGADILVEARAGEPWDGVVAESVRRGCQGLECLSGIPGLVGATPIQNVGAYGQEVAETIREVRVLERATLVERALPAADCRFSYRNSFFKSEAPERYLVLGVTFCLRPGGRATVRYAELERRLAADGIAPDQAALPRVRDTVLELRRGKSMVLDPKDDNRRSCGSFFVNPVVSGEQADAIATTLGEAKMPRFPQTDGRVKLAAGWLIEQAGFAKGIRRGPVGLSSKHALAIVCHDGASAADVFALAREIEHAVRARFGVSLEREPVTFR